MTNEEKSIPNKSVPMHLPRDGDIVVVNNGTLHEVVIISPVYYLRPLNGGGANKIVPVASDAFVNGTVTIKRRTGDLIPEGIALKEFIISVAD